MRAVLKRIERVEELLDALDEAFLLHAWADARILIGALRAVWRDVERATGPRGRGVWALATAMNELESLVGRVPHRGASEREWVAFRRSVRRHVRAARESVDWVRRFARGCSRG